MLLVTQALAEFTVQRELEIWFSKPIGDTNGDRRSLRIVSNWNIRSNENVNRRRRLSAEILSLEQMSATMQMLILTGKLCTLCTLSNEAEWPARGLVAFQIIWSNLKKVTNHFKAASSVAPSTEECAQIDKGFYWICLIKKSKPVGKWWSPPIDFIEVSKAPFESKR